MWNPPTGPPNDVRLRPADARRQVTQAISAAQARDRELRDEVAALTTRRVELAAELAAAVAAAAESRELAKRALLRSEESAREGQRTDAARWTDAARVFALRMRDARARAAALEPQVPGSVAAVERAKAAMVANAAHLNQVALARMVALNPRKAARLQEEVEDAKAEVSAPVDFLVAATEREARAALEAAGALATAAPTVPVALDDLEDEVDLAAADPLLDELRAELEPEEPPASPPTADGGQSSPVRAGRG
jgi:hypothetical protein